FYALPAEGEPALVPGLTLSGSASTVGACSVRDGRLSVNKIERGVVWGECASAGGRAVVLGVPGDAGLGPSARSELREEILAVIRRTRFGPSRTSAGTPLQVPVLPVPPVAADERRDAWQVFQGDTFTIGLPPGFRAMRLDLSVPAPRAIPGGIGWLRGRFVDRDGSSIAVGDGTHAGYLARVEAEDEAWRAGVAPPLGAPGADRLDEAELHDLALEWTGATKAVVSHWKEPGFSGDWLVFRLHLRGSGIEIGLPVISGWRSLALFWIPVTWRGPGRSPAPPPIDPAVALGVRFDRLGPAEKRQALVEGTLQVGTLRLDIPRGYWPVANLAAPDGLPVTVYDAAGAVAGRIESVPAAGLAAILAGEGWTPQPRPASRKAASIHVRPDGACVLVAKAGDGYVLAPEGGGKERAGAWQRLVESASFVKAARRLAPGREED
ncbi:MAG TPA: hypothetical protein VJ826_07935, partial [Candidatus Polarisedimenticolaceae bacterium]|nr:hypothetical protein [Candidatus Polarisedimenticolaceae bacterium]